MAFAFELKEAGILTEKDLKVVRPITKGNFTGCWIKLSAAKGLAISWRTGLCRSAKNRQRR